VFLQGDKIRKDAGNLRYSEEKNRMKKKEEKISKLNF
jgi:hypothetical protein